MKILCIIPARKSSERLKNKNIKLLCGKPLISYSIEHALSSNYIDEICVSSDCNNIKEISNNYNITFIKRPKDLCTSEASSESALIHTIDFLKNKNKEFDYIVFLQCTSPIRRKNDIDDAIQLLIDNDADSLFSSFKDFSFSWSENSNQLESFNYDYKSRKREQDFKPYINENGSIYIFKPEILKNFNNRLGGKIINYDMPEWTSFQIDDIYDFEIISSIMSNKFFYNKIDN